MADPKKLRFVVWHVTIFSIFYTLTNLLIYICIFK